MNQKNGGSNIIAHVRAVFHICDCDISVGEDHAPFWMKTKAVKLLVAPYKNCQYDA